MELQTRRCVAVAANSSSCPQVTLHLSNLFPFTFAFLYSLQTAKRLSKQSREVDAIESSDGRDPRGPDMPRPVQSSESQSTVHTLLTSPRSSQSIIAFYRRQQRSRHFSAETMMSTPIDWISTAVVRGRRDGNVTFWQNLYFICATGRPLSLSTEICTANCQQLKSLQRLQKVTADIK